MKKVINPCICDVCNGKPVRAFAEIEYKDGRLSIRGVIGPTRSGCIGSCGQCVDEIRCGKPIDGWNDEMLQKFCNVWDRWHLNDMHPYCEHQKMLGWDVLAKKEVALYHYSLTTEAFSRKKAAENAAIEALRNGETFTPSKEQVMFATLPHSITSHEELAGDFARYYKPKKALFAGDKGAVEHKTLGWLKQEEHPSGLLCRPCPECGYKYGTEWKMEKVPDEVIDWLFGLPDTTVKPAWV